MNETQVTTKKNKSLQKQRKELEQMDKETQFMVEKVTKMRVLNQLKLEGITWSTISHHIRAEEQMKELDGQDQKSKAKTDGTGSSDKSNNSMDSDKYDIK